MTITWGLNLITRQVTPLFLSFLWALSVGILYFISAFQYLQNLVPWGPSPFSIMFWSVKLTHLHAKDDKHKHFFSSKNLLTFVIWLQFDTNFAPIPWTKYFEVSFSAFFALHLLCYITPNLARFACLFSNW